MSATEGPTVANETPADDARRFVKRIFIFLGASFWFSALLLIWEFWNLDWTTLAVTHSHLFIYFPIFGTLTLLAFYMPAVVLRDFYWRFFQPHGRLRFRLGFAIVVTMAISMAWLYSISERRAVWEVAPAALLADVSAKSGPVERCSVFQIGGRERETVRHVVEALAPGRSVDAAGPFCTRRPILAVIKDIRATAASRPTFSEFARSCVRDELVEPSDSERELRRCFASGSNLTALQCCEVQFNLKNHVRALATAPATRSLLSRFEEFALALKVFFIIVIAVVGFLLALRQDQIAEVYRMSVISALIRGVVLGSAAIMLWPLADFGHQLVVDVMYGRLYRGAFPTNFFQLVPLIASLAIISLLAINFYFFIRRAQGEAPSLASIGPLFGTVISGGALLTYDLFGNIGLGVIGAGATIKSFAVLFVASLVGIAVSIYWHNTAEETLLKLAGAKAPGTAKTKGRPPNTLIVSPDKGPEAIYIVTSDEVERARQPPPK